jgi:tol-pal system protein YbgF
MKRLVLGFGLVLAAVAYGAGADAQGVQARPDAAPVMPSSSGAPVAKPASGASKASPRKSSGATSKPADPAENDPGLRRRVEQLEEQLMDIQVAIGTLESFNRGSGNRPSGGGASAGATIDAGPRMESLDQRMAALTRQVEALTRELRALEGRGGTAAPSPGPSTRSFQDTGGSRAGEPASVRMARPADGRPEDTIGGLIRDTVPSAPLPPLRGDEEQPARSPGPGTSAASSGRGPIGAATSTDPPTTTASYTAASGNPIEAYDKAYGYLLKQDYQGAELAFGEFLRTFPKHERAGNAQYWLGESYYVRGQYKHAAAAFLKGYRDYADSTKAPDSLLKLSMSLGKLGQQQAACSSLGELSSRFPNAPGHVLARAKAERARAGC